MKKPQSRNLRKVNHSFRNTNLRHTYLTPILLKILFESLGIDLKIFKDLAEDFCLITYYSLKHICTQVRQNLIILQKDSTMNLTLFPLRLCSQICVGEVEEDIVGRGSWSWKILLGSRRNLVQLKLHGIYKGELLETPSLYWTSYGTSGGKGYSQLSFWLRGSCEDP